MRKPGQRTAVDLTVLRAAIGAVLDPEIRRPLAELGMLGDVRVDRRGRVYATVRLTTASCPLTGQLRADVSTAAGAVPGVLEVHVEFGELAMRERAELAERLRTSTRPVTGGSGSRTRVYAVASGKGGVGKSTITANLAAALAATGQRVGVLDADVWGYSVPQLFGVWDNPVTVGGLMMPLQAHGVALMSVGFLVPEGQPVVWRGPMLHKALEQFLTDTHWAEPDVLLIDLPPGTGDVTLALLELVPDAALLAVTTPQLAAHSVAARVLRMARELGMPVAGVVENMSATCCSHCGRRDEMFGAGGGMLLAQEADAPLLGRVPLDLALREAGDRGVPVVVGQPASASARELVQIAAALPVVRRSLVGRPLPLSVVSTG
ncbi:MAG: Mrp/NBP35 family ATP-binding protein [Pseudonocardiaceae bacterium]